jgi:hypothetical protein
VNLQEERVDKAVSDSVAAQFRSAFPAGTFTQVDVLGYGDEPDVEPGETAIRAFIDRAGCPARTVEDDEAVIRAFGEANDQVIRKLHRERLLPGVAWVLLIPDTPDRRAPDAVLWGFPCMFLGLRPDGPEEGPGFATVHVHLRAADLATVDALITAGTVATRAEAVRWAISRLREDPPQS